VSKVSGLFDQIEWQPLESACDLAALEDCATHRGVLKVETNEIACYRFSDGSTAIDVEDIEQFFRGCPRCFAPSPFPDEIPSSELSEFINYRLALLLED
jgi:hypothetical protein